MPRRLIAGLMLILAAAALATLVQKPARAGNIHQDFGIDINDPDNPYDNTSSTFRQRWDSSFLPLKMHIYRDPFTNAILDPATYDPGPGSDFAGLPMRDQLENSLAAWNGCDFSSFAFDEDLAWADLTHAQLANGLGQFFWIQNTALDGVNLITFQDESVALDADEAAVTSLWTMLEDWNVLEQRQFDVEVIVNPSVDAAALDLDEDGLADVLMPLRGDGWYRQGEIIDADIIGNPTVADWLFLPEDPGDLDVPVEDILGGLEVEATVTHELGHVQGVAHAFLWEPTMQPFVSITLPSGEDLGVNPYDKRTPELDDFISQALQYPAELPADLGAFSGQVLNGDYLDGSDSGDDPADPFILQTPVYVCVPASSVFPNPDFTTISNSGGSYSEVDLVASFNDEPMAAKVPYLRLASVPVGLDLRVPLIGGTVPQAPASSLGSTFYMPGLPIRGDYALFTDNPQLDNVNAVMTELAPDFAYDGEFYGGANAPGLGTGYVDSNEDVEDNLIATSYIEAAVDDQGRYSIGVPARSGAIGLALVKGHETGVLEHGFASFRLDGETFNMREEAPGQVVNAMTIDDISDRAMARWRIDHGSGLLEAPISLAFKNDGKLYVGEGNSNSVNRYNANTGLFEAIFATGGISTPRAMIFDKQGRLYVASEGTDEILRFNGTTGDFIDVYASGNGLDAPRGMIFDTNGDLLVCSYGSNQVLRFSAPDGAATGFFLDALVGDDPATAGVDESGGLIGPNDLAIDSAGNLHVTSEGTNSVMRYYGSDADLALQGKPRGLLGMPSDATMFTHANLEAPYGLVISAAGEAAVGSFGTNAILKYNTQTAIFEGYMVAPNIGGLYGPLDIAFGPSDQYVYVCSETQGRVLRYDRRTGAFLDTFASSEGDVLVSFEARLTNAGAAELEDNPRTPNDVSIVYRFQNLSSSPATIELRQIYDLVIMGREGPYFFIDSDQVTTTMTWNGAEIPKYLVFQDSLVSPMLKAAVTLTGPGTGGTPPAKVVLDTIDNLEFTDWSGDASGDALVESNGSPRDTGIAVFYGPVTIAPGESVDMGCMVGTVLDNTSVMHDHAFGALAEAEGTIWYEDPTIAERLATLPGTEVGGILIVTDNGDAVPTGEAPLPPGVTPPPGGVFTMENDRLPQYELTSEDGVAADFDNDGDLDICLIVGPSAGGSQPFNRLLENRLFPDGDLRFRDVTFGPDGIPGVGVDNLPINIENSTGVAAADFNNDGYVDLVFSNAVDLSTPGVNRIYLNRGDGTFEDVTMLQPYPLRYVLPGVLDTDPVEGADISMKPAVGDIDSDGDIDIIFPLRGTGVTDEAATALFQDVLASTGPPNPQQHFDGIFIPDPGGQDVQPYQVDVAQGTAIAPARVMVNQLIETGVMHFLDDTLGRDHTFGGFQPVGGAPIEFENIDRMPPIIPDATQQTGNQGESVLGTSALLGAFMGDDSLDLLISESTLGSGETNGLTQGGIRTYINIGIGEDGRPDGYFAQVNYGTDFNFYPLASDGTQQDFTPMLVSVPDAYPDSGGTTGGDVIPTNQASVNALGIADLNCQGVMSIITALTTGASYHLDNSSWGWSKNALTGGSGNAYVTQGIADMHINTLADRTFPTGDPLQPGPDPIVILPDPATPADYAYGPGANYDIVESTPQGQTFGNPTTLGNWSSTDIATSDGFRTRDLAMADFDRDGYYDAFYASDRPGGDSPTAGQTEPAPNQYFVNDQSGTLTDDSALALAMETDARSAGVIQGDFDNDGDEDLYICNTLEQDHLLRNYTYHATPDLADMTDPELFYDNNVDFLPPASGYIIDFPNTGGSGNTTFSTVVADLNCDGRPDIYTGNGGESSAPYGDINLWYLNSGELQSPGIQIMRLPDSVYPAPAIFQTFGYPVGSTTGVETGDIDGDGDFDIVNVDYAMGPLVIFNEDLEEPDTTFPDADSRGDGNLVFEELVIPVLDNPLCGTVDTPVYQKTLNTSVALGDLDGDGDLDMVVGNGSPGLGAMNLLLLNDLNNSGMFIDVSQSERLPRWSFEYTDGVETFDCIQGIYDDTRAVSVGDFNHDGHLDIFLANTTIPDLAIAQRLQPDARSDAMIGSRLLINHERIPGSGEWGYFVDETEARLPASFLNIERVSQPVASVIKIGDFDGLGERSEDLNYNGVLDPGYDLDGDGMSESGEDSFFSYLSSNRGSIAPDNGVLDFQDSNGNGVPDLSLDIFIGYEDAPDVMLYNDGTGFFTDASNKLPNTGISITTLGADAGDVDLDGDLDLVLGLDVSEVGTPGGEDPVPTVLLTNDGLGSFTDVSYETPLPLSLRDTADSLLTYAQDVDFVDIDSDGDLDLYVSLSGPSMDTTVQGVPNYILINRLIGSNWNAERTTVARVPGKPVVKVVSPPGAVPGQALTVQVSGANFSEGCEFDFGTGIDIVGDPLLVSASKMSIQLQISQNAPLGPRSVKVTDDGGRSTLSNLGVFNVFDHMPSGVGTAVRNGQWMLYETQTADNVIQTRTPGAAPSHE